MFDDDEYGAPYIGPHSEGTEHLHPTESVVDLPPSSPKLCRLRDRLVRVKARGLASAQRAQILRDQGDTVAARSFTKEARKAKRQLQRISRKVAQERASLARHATAEQKNMLEEQAVADEAGAELLQGDMSQTDFLGLDAIDLDEDLAAAEVSATSFGSYTDRAQYDPKTQMLLDMGYALEDFSVDARLDKQLQELADMGISISGDDLYTQSPTLDYAVPSDIADAGMFSADTDFLDSTAPTGLWEDGVVDEFESGDVSMGDAYGRVPSGWSGGSIGKMFPMSFPVRPKISDPLGDAARAASIGLTPKNLTAQEKGRVKKHAHSIKRWRQQVRKLRKAQRSISRLSTDTSKVAASYRRKIRNLRKSLRALKRHKIGPLKGKPINGILALRLKKKVKKLSKGLRNVNKRIRGQARLSSGNASKILSKKNNIAKSKGAMQAIYSKAHQRAGNQAAAAKAEQAKVAAQAEADKQKKEAEVTTIIAVATDKILEGQETQDKVFTKKAELEAEIANTDLSPGAVSTPKVKELEAEVIHAASEADFGMVGLFEGVDAMANVDLTPTFTESYVPTEAGDGGWVDVPEQWDADYYEPEWEEEYLEPMEEQQDAAYYAAPYNTESGLSDEWDSTQQRLDDQLAQLAEWGVSISGDSYGVDPWDQFGDDLYSQWPTLDYAVPSDIADSGMFGDDEFGFNLTSGSGKPFDFSSLGTGSGGSAPKGPAAGGGGPDAPSGDSILGFIGTLASGALNLGASAVANAGKGNKKAGNWGSKTQKNLGKANTKVQNTVASTPTPPPTAAEIAAAMKANEPPATKPSILPWVGVGLAGTAIIGTGIWAITR